MTIGFSAHAIKRMNHRGVRKTDIGFVLEHASRWTNVGGGLVSVSLTKQDQQGLRKLMINNQAMDRLTRTFVVMDPESNEVITIIKGGNRRYRRSH